MFHSGGVGGIDSELCHLFFEDSKTHSHCQQKKVLQLTELPALICETHLIKSEISQGTFKFANSTYVICTFQASKVLGQAGNAYMKITYAQVGHTN